MSNTENTQTIMVFPGNSTFHAPGKSGKTCLCGKQSRRYFPMKWDATPAELQALTACKHCFG